MEFIFFCWLLVERALVVVAHGLGSSVLVSSPLKAYPSSSSMAAGMHPQSSVISNRITDCPDVERRVAGEVGTASFAVFFYCRGQLVSPWHNIPLRWMPTSEVSQQRVNSSRKNNKKEDGEEDKAEDTDRSTDDAHDEKTATPAASDSDGDIKGDDRDNKLQPVFNMVVEIPKGGVAKLEIQTTEPFNPIRQDRDSRTGDLRFLKPPGGMPANYGAFPQTWSDPRIKGTLQGTQNAPGDNDPLDVVELGDGPLLPGSIVQVRVIGALPLIDQGELDWKILVLRLPLQNVDSLSALSSLSAFNLSEFEKLRPRRLDSVREFFRTYKARAAVDGNLVGLNRYGGSDGHNNWLLGRRDALRVVEDSHEQYMDLMYGGNPSTEEMRPSRQKSSNGQLDHHRRSTPAARRQNRDSKEEEAEDAKVKSLWTQLDQRNDFWLFPSQ